MLAKTIFYLLSSTSFALFSGDTMVFPTSDYYPNRSTLNRHAQEICRGFSKDSTYGTKKLKFDLATLFNTTVTALKITANSSGGNIDAALATLPPMNINIVYNNANLNTFSFTVKRPKEEIEPISRINLSGNCQLYQAYNTYFNQQQRPSLRIRTDANEKEIFRVKMEEAPSDSLESSDGFLKVGFIDSGLDYNHPSVISKSRPLVGIDLTNPARPPYDYTNTIQNELMGTSYAHGTAVADVATKNINVHIIPVRIENKSSLSGQAVKYLANKGVRLVNISQGSWRKDEWLDFRQAALAHPEILFIVAAGNESLNIDITPTYPAGFEIPNMIVVASVNFQGEFSKNFSNYGPKHVHVAAVGENVTAAKAGGGESVVSGTSFAAPQVTRLAAKILMNQRGMSTEELKRNILTNARQTPQLQGKVRFGVIDTF